MNNITMIKVEQLEHHPENPRKDLGDLTELVESIKANGIMQNLTVVKNKFVPDLYTVVIGNRRMEAAKMAGLAEVPCVISEMDPRTQISTMLMENMQRADLTAYEQAQGFQLMMDLGFTAKEIGEKTGFSEKTVKDRIRFTKLNQKNFSDAVAKGATLMDMLEISKLKSKNDQNEVMKAAGTNNFRRVLKEKLSEQKYEENCEHLRKICAEEGLQEIPKGASVWQEYTSQGTPTGTYEKDEKVRAAIKKMVKGNKDVQLFFQFGKDWGSDDARLQIYKKKEAAQAVDMTEEEKKRKEYDRARQKKVREVKKLWAETYRLRMDFIREYTVTNGFGMTTISKLILRYALSQQVYWGRKPLPERHDWKEKYIRDALGIQQEEYEENKSLWTMIEERGIPQIRATIAWVCGGGVFDCDTPEAGKYHYYDGDFSPNSNDGMMDERYEFLKEIGYEMSDLEIQLMDGTHPVYQGVYT